MGISHVCEDGKKERSREKKKNVHVKACGKRAKSDMTRGTGSWRSGRGSWGFVKTMVRFLGLCSKSKESYKLFKGTIAV